MDDYERYLSKQMDDPEFQAEWEALQPEMGEARRADTSVRPYDQV